MTEKQPPAAPRSPTLGELDDATGFRRFDTVAQPDSGATLCRVCDREDGHDGRHATFGYSGLVDCTWDRTDHDAVCEAEEVGPCDGDCRGEEECTHEWECTECGATHYC